MKTLLNSLLFFVFILQAEAQVPQWAWVKTYGSSVTEGGSTCAVDDSGNVYVGIWQLLQQEFYLIKYSPNGQAIWSKNIQSSGLFGSVSAIKFDHSGNLLVGGNFSSTMMIDSIRVMHGGGNTALTTFLAKLTPDGEVLWLKDYGGRMDTPGMVLDVNDNIYINNYVNFDDSSGRFEITPIGGADIVFTKLDREGEIVWLKQVKGTGYDYGMVITINSANELFLAGGSESDTLIFDQDTLLAEYHFNVPVRTRGQMWLAKYDTSGSVNWVRSLGGSQQDGVRGIATDHGGNVFITGRFKDSANVGPILITNSRHRESPFVAKYGGDGTVQWVSSLDGFGGYSVSGTSIITDPEGNVYATGIIGDSTKVQSTFLRRRGMFVAKWTNAGNLVWAINNEKVASAECIARANDGGLLVTGSYNPGAAFGSTVPVNAGGEDMFLAKLSQPTSISNPQSQTSAITVFPNPASGHFTVTYANSHFTGLQLTDLQGRQLYYQHLNTNAQQATVQLPHLAQGVYLLQLKGAGEQAASKLMIR